jgi:hypothetical protein
MEWDDNFPPLASFDFSNDADNLILRVFDTATKTLDEEWKENVKRFKEYISIHTAEDEIGIAIQENDNEEDLHRQRMQGVGALALDWLMSSFKSALCYAKAYLDKSRPADPKGYSSKKGWLIRVSQEYRDRFGIDFTTGPVPFDRFEELVFARNAGIHREEEGTLGTHNESHHSPKK